MAATYTFGPGAATGRYGPTQAQIDTLYNGTNLAGKVTVNNGIQTFTLTQGGKFRITAIGAAGATGDAAGGKGAKIVSEHQISPGTVLNIVVGQPGVKGDSNGGGGGGGSFVYTGSIGGNGLLVAAGGGGGGGQTSGWGGNGSDTTNSTSGGGTGTFPNKGIGQGGSTGTSASYSGLGGGGCGWLSDGDSYPGIGNGGTRFVGGAAQSFHPTAVGGFGGGAGSGGNGVSGGGGGGYTGGGGGKDYSNTYGGGGGGGSYSAGTITSAVAGFNTGAGSVIIEVLSVTHYIMQDGQDLKVVQTDAQGVKSWVKVGDAPVTIDKLKTLGTMDLLISKAGIVSTTPKLYVWEDSPGSIPSSATIGKIPAPKTIIMKQDITFAENNIKTLQSLNILNTITGNGVIIAAISPDHGNTWYGLQGLQWVTVDISNVSDFIAKGIDVTKLKDVTPVQLSALLNQKCYRLAFLGRINKATDVLKLSGIKSSFIPN